MVRVSGIGISILSSWAYRRRSRTELPLEEVADAPFKIVYGTEWVAAPHEAGVTTAQRKLHFQRNIAVCNRSNFVQNSRGKKRVVDSIQE